METCFIENAPYVSGIYRGLFKVITGQTFEKYFTYTILNANEPENARRLWEAIVKSEQIWCCSPMRERSKDMFDGLLEKAIEQKLTGKVIFNLNSLSDVFITQSQKTLMDTLTQKFDIRFIFYDEIKDFFTK